MTISSCGASEDILRALEEPPNIENRFAAQIKLLIDAVRRAENKHIAAFDDLFDRPQLGIALNEGIRRQHLSYIHHEGPFELVTEGGADVIAFSLKGHAQQPHGGLGKIAQTAH